MLLILAANEENDLNFSERAIWNFRYAFPFASLFRWQIVMMQYEE